MPQYHKPTLYQTKHHSAFGPKMKHQVPYRLLYRQDSLEKVVETEAHHTSSENPKPTEDPINDILSLPKR